LKGVIQDLSESLELTCLLVSHDSQDVLSWAEEILVLQEGRIIQQGAPAEVYNNPVNEYAAALFGTYNRVSPALMKLFFPHSFVTLNNVNRFIRPEHFVLSHTEDSGVKGVVIQVRFMGSYFELEVMIEGNTIRVNNNGNTYKKGDIVFVALAKRHPW
jgi:ABC-type Fe3+/spermidine/putrescine transport system ATPase subunit